MNSFNRWIRSKQGLTILGVLVVLVLVLAVLVTQTEIFGTAGGKKKGEETPTVVAGEPTATVAEVAVTAQPTKPPLAEFAAPVDGVTCLPTCAENDGRFFILNGSSVNSFAGNELYLWIAVPGQASTFALDIFDGDNGLNGSGDKHVPTGNWDNSTYFEVYYTLYADPLATGTPVKEIASWKGNADKLPNNAWYQREFSQEPLAQGPSGHYFYLLKVMADPGDGFAVFKVRSTGYLSAGKGDLTGKGVGLWAGYVTLSDRKIIYPAFASNSNTGPSPYNGDWSFFFYLADDSKSIEIWDGDLDRGTTAEVDPDTDDPNTVGHPEWAVGATVDERAAGQGAPQENNVARPQYIRGGSITYQVKNPDNVTIYTNSDPSGTEEWEKYVIAREDAKAEFPDADQYVPELKAGLYTIELKGVDLNNSIWFKVDNDMCDVGDSCGPDPYPEAFCPRTIGYWKNNVRKLLMDNPTMADSVNGAQETVTSLHKALNYIAVASPLYRSGLNVANPEKIEKIAPLTDLEANNIMQKVAGNSMLDRALQQNLATWLNMATGKIGPHTVVTINTPNGTFQGTLMKALETAQEIILSGDDAKMAYAKDIADMINNGQVDMDPEANIDASGAPVCTIYNQVIPPDKQRPTHDKLPKGQKPPEEPFVPLPPKDEATCTGRENKYQVESATNNPFYGIKFNYLSGTEVKGSDSDIFKYTVPAQMATDMAKMFLEAKAGEITYQTELACDFTSEMGCDPVGDPLQFKFQFLGSTDNGDGTRTLSFQVWNYTSFGLSHATFGLLDGVVPTSPTGEYSVKVCAP